MHTLGGSALPPRVGFMYSRRNFMVPILRSATWDELNAYLEARCRLLQNDRLRGESETIGERLQRDPASMREFPAPRSKPVTRPAARSRRSPWCATRPTTIPFRLPLVIKTCGSAVMSAKW